MRQEICKIEKLHQHLPEMCQPAHHKTSESHVKTRSKWHEKTLAKHNWNTRQIRKPWKTQRKHKFSAHYILHKCSFLENTRTKWSPIHPSLPKNTKSSRHLSKKHAANQPAIHPARQTARQPVSRPISQPATQPTTQRVRAFCMRKHIQNMIEVRKPRENEYFCRSIEIRPARCL